MAGMNFKTRSSLDVDDTTSFGPETITISQTNPGVYHYYIHDYTDRNSESSTALAESGAQIKLYTGDRLLYTINVPINNGGTLWHVFDYDAEKDEIILVNEFSYLSSPSAVGGSETRAIALYTEKDNKKTDDDKTAGGQTPDESLSEEKQPESQQPEEQPGEEVPPVPDGQEKVSEAVDSLQDIEVPGDDKSAPEGNIKDRLGTDGEQ